MDKAATNAIDNIDNIDKVVHRISVRNLVEFILRSGDINLGGYISSQMMHEGTMIHKKIQKEASDDYKAEVRLSLTREYNDYILEVSGIADGVVTTKEGVTIDEIKTVSVPLDYIDGDYSPMHWAQAKCYAYIHAAQSGIDKIYIRLTYFNTETKKMKYIIKEFSYCELESFFNELIRMYSIWSGFIVNHKKDRDDSISRLLFPYKSYRKGQRDLAVSVYYAIRDKSKLFARAPTGIGKTISVLFPSLKALGNGMGEKIFYLTARTITRQAAEDALITMRDKGLNIKHVTITSKDKICPNETRSCNPIDCIYARGHFDRINDAILDILKNESIITREAIISYSQKHMVCPFEYTLDISNWVDCIVCDYNYAFDPRAYLRRYFEDGGDYIMLVDEAHNLVDRAREMFSVSLTKSDFMKLKRDIKESAPDVYRSLNMINKFFIELRKKFEKRYETLTIDLPTDIYQLINNFIEECESYLFQHGNSKINDALLELFFGCLSFNAVYRLYDHRYITYITRTDSDVTIKLFCIDPSHLLSEACKKGRTSIFFSATLMPLKYYFDMLGGDESDRVAVLPSPFDKNNMCLMVIGNLSTRYKDREESLMAIINYIKSTADQKLGNYLVFFPSFEYMNTATVLYKESWPDDQIIIQNRSMTEKGREDFLLSFKEQPDKTLIGFAVLGGIFSEGIDLIGEKLSGAIIIGVGLPQICDERDIIKDYFDETNRMGYDYSYRFPGMNRVLQAAGRVIRAEQDRGFIMLIDD
ncbi:MAG TPA: ATP-dependent DNA helicase, partial [Clostridiales bacterium]|nr:ATP-dependent DNA helicase [Clostridiales bacterium]